MTSSIIPQVGLGTWLLRGSACVATVKQALDLGYRHIDTADAYGNHSDIGQGIRDFPRRELFLTTKVRIDRLLPSDVNAAVPRFLEELNVEYVDLLLVHWPNPDVDLVETLKAMLTWVEKGAVRHIGISNFVRFHLDALAPYKFPILTNQIELHPYLQRRLLVKKCQEMGIAVTAYRPLAKGAFEKDPVMRKIGARHGKSASQVALRWLVQQGLAVIPKASSQQHLQANLNIFDFALDKDEMQQIHALDAGKRYCSPDGYPVYED